MQRIIVLAVLGVAVIALFAFIWKRPSSAPPIGEQATSLRPAPDFSLQDYNGKTVTLSQLRGKAVVVNSWAAWCPFCREELRDFAAVQKEFGDRVVIIAIDRAEPLATAKKYTDELAVADELAFLLDPEDSFYRSIGGFSMPETIFVDAEGKIIFHKRGPMDRAEIRQRVEQILNSKPETLNKSQ